MDYAQLAYHEHANLFPLLEGEELQALADDLARHGLKRKIVLHEGKILDGRNRYRAAQFAGFTLTPSNFVEFGGPDTLSHVLSANVRRRHMNESQRAIVAAQLSNMRMDGCSETNIYTQADSAKLLNVSRHLVVDARFVLDHADDATIASIEAGRLAVTKAADELRLAANAAPDKKTAKGNNGVENASAANAAPAPAAPEPRRRPKTAEELREWRRTHRQRQTETYRVLAERAAGLQRAPPAAEPDPAGMERPAEAEGPPAPGPDAYGAPPVPVADDASMPQREPPAPVGPSFGAAIGAVVEGVWSERELEQLRSEINARLGARIGRGDVADWLLRAPQAEWDDLFERSRHERSIRMRVGA